MFEFIMPIIPAAGASSRLGCNKQLLEYRGQTLIRRAVQLCAAAGLGRATVVTGFEQQRISNAIGDLDVDLLHNPEWANGLGGSIAAGAQWVRQHYPACAGVLVLLPDQFRVETSHLLSMAQSLSLPEWSIVATDYGAELGTPVLFASQHLDELVQLSGPRGAKSLLAAHPAVVARCLLPEAVLDVDTPRDIRLLNL